MMSKPPETGQAPLPANEPVRAAGFVPGPVLSENIGSRP